VAQSGHLNCAPSHLASQIQQRTRPQRQRHQNADRHVIESVHGIATASPALPIHAAIATFPGATVHFIARPFVSGFHRNAPGLLLQYKVSLQDGRESQCRAILHNI